MKPLAKERPSGFEPCVLGGWVGFSVEEAPEGEPMAQSSQLDTFQATGECLGTQTYCTNAHRRLDHKEASSCECWSRPPSPTNGK